MKRTIAMDRQMNALRRDRPLCAIAIRFTRCEPEGETGKRLPSRGVTAPVKTHVTP